MSGRDKLTFWFVVANAFMAGLMIGMEAPIVAAINLFALVWNVGMLRSNGIV